MMPMTTALGYAPFIQQSGPPLSPSLRSWRALDQAIQHGTPLKTKGLPPLHLHEEHEVNLVAQGFGRVTLGEAQRLSFGAGQLLFLPSGIAHRIDSPLQLVLKGFHLHPRIVRGLAGEVAAELLQPYSQVPASLPACLVHTREFHLMLELVERSLDEWSRTSIWRTAHLRATRDWLCVTLLSLLRDEATTGHDCLTRHRVAQVKVWIDEHYATKITVSELAAMADLSPTYFSTLFQQLYHVAPRTYQRQCCLRSAAHLLMQSNLPIHIIAGQLGFGDLAHFSHAFRSYMGMSPREYRAMHQTATESMPARRDIVDDADLCNATSPAQQGSDNHERRSHGKNAEG